MYLSFKQENDLRKKLKKELKHSNDDLHRAFDLKRCILFFADWNTNIQITTSLITSSTCPTLVKYIINLLLFHVKCAPSLVYLLNRSSLERIRSRTSKKHIPTWSRIDQKDQEWSADIYEIWSSIKVTYHIVHRRVQQDSRR